jgi:hypothetical protein
MNMEKNGLFKKLFLFIAFLILIAIVIFISNIYNYSNNNRSTSINNKLSVVELNAKIIKNVDASVSEEEQIQEIETVISDAEELKREIDCFTYIKSIESEEKSKEACDSLKYAYTYWVPNKNPDRYHYYGSKYFVGLFEFENEEYTKLLYQSFILSNENLPFEQNLVQKTNNNILINHWSSHALNENNKISEYRHMIIILDGTRLIEIVSMEENVDVMLNNIIELISN